MKTLKFKTEDAWLDARRGKITGTKLSDLTVRRGTGKKLGYYELIAERVALPPSNENAMDRGKRLEQEAVERLSKETNKKFVDDLVLWVRDDNPDIAISPDAYCGKTVAAEVKCLASALHIKAILTKEIPSEFHPQMLQYFIVNDSLRELYFVFYDPRMPKDFFYIKVLRKDVKDDIKTFLELERETIKEMEKIENDLTF